MHLMRARKQLLAFLLRHGRSGQGKASGRHPTFTVALQAAEMKCSRNHAAEEKTCNSNVWAGLVC